MEIRKLFERGIKKNDVGLNNSAEQINISKEIIKDIEFANQDSSVGEGDDVVKLSGLSRQLFQISEIVDGDQSARSERIEQLKKAIADGTYSVSSNDLAKSLVSFARELPEQKEI